jgi:Protein of unknown function (DUF2877)
MNTNYRNAPVEVHSIGNAASAVLSAAQHGTVLASVNGADYLQNQLGELCWLIPMDAPMHQRAIRIDGQVPRLCPGIGYQVTDHTLEIGLAKILDFRHSHAWTEPNLSANGAISISALFGSLSLVVERLFNLCIPSGFGCLIMPILQLATHKVNVLAPCSENRIAEKAWSEVKGMIQASRDRDVDHFFYHAKSLVGMGQGLTPSGDDFLGGFFFSMKLLKDDYRQSVTLPDCTHSDFILQWSTLTSRLSYSILLDNIDGHSVEPLHHLAAGLLTGLPADQLLSHAGRLVRLGHSTGWDLLAGFFAGMSSMISQ